MLLSSATPAPASLESPSARRPPLLLPCVRLAARFAILLVLLPFSLRPSVASAQTPATSQLKSQLNSQLKAQPRAVPDPTTPPARSFHDPRSGVTLQVPAGWNLTVKDGDVSTFQLDARSAPRATQMRALASIAFNPYPESTFSGAFFYLSLNPRLAVADCAREATTVAQHPVSTTKLGGVDFQRGYEEHGGACIESRDDIYTAFHNGACYRFDLILNTFCGGDVSGVRDITPQQLDAVRKRLEAILATVQFDK